MNTPAKRWAATVAVLTAACLAAVPLIRADNPASTPSTVAGAAWGPDYPITAVSPHQVQLNDVFWTPRLEINRTVTIPLALQKCTDSGRVDNFVRAAAALRGETLTNTKPPANLFDDAEVYRAIEAASCALKTTPDPKVDAALDDLIAKIAAAQEKDGYLYTTRTIDPAHPPAAAGAERWAMEKANSYELYDLGCLYEAAVAHYEATGKRSLLNVAIKSADLLDSTFGPGKKLIWPGHEMVEMGLADLARATGERRYAVLAKFFIDQRGPDANAEAGAGTGRGRGGTAIINQAQAKVVDQSAATGNALGAAFLYSAATDVAALANDTSYAAALDKVWQNEIGMKLYVTGGIGVSTADGNFSRVNYQLPNTFAASPTAAAAANILWNQRLFLARGDGKNVDVLERMLYNGLLVGPSQDGKRVFETNAIEALTRPPQRADILNLNTVARPVRAGDPPATPSGAIGPMTRILASVPGLIYGQNGDTVYVNLYAAGAAEIKLGTTAENAIHIAQETRYPWDGAVKMTVTLPNADKATKLPFTLNIRIPGWARNEAVPGDLYSFADKNDEPVVLKVNGESVSAEAKQGYASITRSWTNGDMIELNLPMPVRRLRANDQILDGHGRVALQRGPLVYCIESVDNPDKRVRNVSLPDANKLSAEFRADLLGGVSVITGKAVGLHIDEQDQLQHPEQDFMAIPYFAWANRGPGQMLVWIPNGDTGAGPTAAPNLSANAKVTASPKLAGQATDGRAAKDGIEPRSSHDNGPLAHFDWWPDNNTTSKGKPVWIEYTFDKPTTMSQTQVYWWDDTIVGGGCQVPAGWKALYKDGDDWKPVETTDTFGTAKDQYNKVNFKPVTSTALRLEITLPDRESVGIQEWKVR